MGGLRHTRLRTALAVVLATLLGLALPTVLAPPAGAANTATTVDAVLMDDVRCIDGTAMCIAVGVGVNGGVVVPVLDGVVGQTHYVANTDLHGIDCSSATTCLAVGETLGADPRPTWVPITVGATTIALGTVTHYVVDGMTMDDVACISTGACFGVGTSMLSGSPLGYLMDIGGGGFQPHLGTTAMRSISCADTRCAIVADSHAGEAAIITIQSPTWHPQDVQTTPAGIGAFDPYNVECLSDTTCHLVMFGAGGRVVRFSPTFPNASDVTTSAQTSRLTGISCLSETRCVASTQAGSPLKGGLTFLEDLVPTGREDTTGSELRNVDCWSATECVAVGATPSTIAVYSFTAPTITTQPASQQVAEGSTVTLSVVATGDPGPTSYQWYERDIFADTPRTPIVGATSSSWTSTAVLANNRNRYSVDVTSFAGTTTSAEVAIGVHPLPHIAFHPDAVESGLVGATVTWQVGISGEGPPTVQWQRAEAGSDTFVDIPGATEQNYSYTIAAGDDFDRFRVVATNVWGSVTTNAGTLRILRAPTITQHPEDVRADAGDTVTFTAAATGYPEPTVQWEWAGGPGGVFFPIEGATDPTLTVVVTPGDQGLIYRAVFTSTAFSQLIRTNTATLSVNSEPGVIQHPASQTVTYGESASFTVQGTGGPAPTVHWERFDVATQAWVEIPFVTHTTLTVMPIVADSGTRIRAVFTNEYGSVPTNEAVLTVNRKTLTVTPDPVSVTYGTTPTFTSTITGFLPGESAESALQAAPTCGVTGAHTDAGTYTITCSGGSAPNYAFTYGTATLTVGQKQLTITPANQTKVYGSADPAFTWTATGFAYGETAAVLDTPPVCTVLVPHPNAGTYTIACGGGADGNYSFAYGTATLTVTKVPLTIVANDASRPYGAANPPLTATLTGFVNGDTAATSVTGQASCTTTATPSSPASGSPYPITCGVGTLQSGNYSFGATVAGKLTVGKAATTLTNSPTERKGLLGYKLTTRLTRTGDGAPLAGRTVKFTVAGVTMCTVKTNADGRASCSFSGLLLGPRTWTSSFAGDPDHTETSKTSNL